MTNVEFLAQMKTETFMGKLLWDNKEHICKETEF